ncbi:MAG: mandelate racemase/muconate lactonizing enzyme family protein [Armatimonadota bacterium]
MKITAIDPFYLRMPQITRAADGTQDTLLVRVRTDDGLEGWGECDASPLVSLAAYCCPMSHGNIINIRESLLGETVESPDDVRRLHAKATLQGMDIQQIHHAYSGTDIALWDLLGKKRGVPVYRLLGGETAHPKLPYASVLFGDTPEETRELASRLRAQGFRAAKFGWGPLGKHGAEYDEQLVRAAREGLGEEAEVMVDAGWAWGHDDETAAARARVFARYRITWLEEPLNGEAIGAYGRLAAREPAVPIAAGESAGNVRAAEDFLESAGLSFIQIDVGRIGGITPSRTVCEQATRRGVTYVNHTFKSRLSVAASIHVFADVEASRYLEYPASGSHLSENLARGLDRDADGLVRAPEKPGLGVEIDEAIVRQYAVPTRIELAGVTVFEGGAP